MGAITNRLPFFINLKVKEGDIREAGKEEEEEEEEEEDNVFMNSKFLWFLRIWLRKIYSSSLPFFSLFV